MRYFAHSTSAASPESWQPLKDHLIGVAERAAEFAAAFGAGDWAYLAGLWHDVGKYSKEFQVYLRNQAEACAETQPGRADHSTAGAQHAVRSVPIIGHLLAYAIAGHHAGLLDGRSEYTCQEKRLKKSLPPWEQGLTELLKPPMPELPAFVREALARKDAFAIAFFARMLFSCLVDADFLDTEAFKEPDRTRRRRHAWTIHALAHRWFESVYRFEAQQRDSQINRLRRSIREYCEAAAEQRPGLFSLTVPTGGGKTLSSMSFAFRHAEHHELRRVIFVAPFTTIIEQNAGVLRRHLTPDAVLEHHHNVDPERETEASRLASENWDMPVIVTTSVQWYESLFSNRPSQCRKLHRIARSVIILDEAQTIPVEYLAPCLAVLKELTRNYGCTVVLCTATQPAVHKRPDFPIGLEGVREIVPDPPALYRKLKRVNVQHLGRLIDVELRDRLLAERQVLCIVNTTRHARQLFETLGRAPGHFHLSARMCPAHRRLRLNQIRIAMDAGQVCRLISTQVVEAGVDLDFPVVYRAMAGLDSIAQAAGRCNRHARQNLPGRTYVFTSEHRSANQYFSETANCAAQIMAMSPDPMDPEAIERFFKLYYWDQKPKWDAHNIMDNFHLVQNRDFPFLFQFETTARNFHLIDDAAYGAVIVPWEQDGAQLCDRLRSIPSPSRELLREAQSFMVPVRRTEWNVHAERDIQLIYDNLGILISPETHYSPDTGLNLESEGPEGYFA